MLFHEIMHLTSLKKKIGNKTMENLIRLKSQTLYYMHCTPKDLLSTTVETIKKP